MAELPVSGLFNLDEMKTPDNTDVLLAIHLDDNGQPDEEGSGYYTVALLIQTLGKVATDAEAGAVTAKKAAELAQSKCEEALAAIGTSDTTGLRGQAITAIQNALTSALQSIGRNDNEGARQAALQAIATALQNALNAIGQSDTAGARGAAITSIAEKLAAALLSISNAATSANQVIDQKVTTATEQAGIATTKAGEASDSAELAEKWAEEEPGVPVEGTGEEAKYSAKHWAHQAEAAADIPLASGSTSGKVYLSDTLDPVDNEPDPNHTAISKPAIRQIVQNINDSIALPIPIIETKFIEGSDEVQMTLQNNYTGFSSVVIRYKTGGDPSETDPEASFPITGSGNDVYYFRAFPGEGATNKPSPSAVINMADYKVATPTYSFDDATDTISFACSTYGATMRLTTNGTEPSATNGELYTAAIKLTNATSFKVKGIKDGLALSDTLSVTISKVATPVFTFSKEAETVAITCSTADAIIKYTTDGSIPSETNGTTYVGAIPVTDTTTFQIKAFKTGWIDSEQVTGKAVFAQIIAVRRPITMTGTAWTRLTPETDPLSVVTETITVEPTGEITGTRTGQSVFDAYAPWQTRMRNFESDGTPGAWQDEEGFTLTDKDVMVYFPKCWIKLTVDTNYITKYISTDEYDGFVYAPWSEEYLARYETSNNNQSRSGKTVQVSQSIVTMRTNARAKGAGWQLYDLPVWHAMQWLFVVEYKDYDCQTLIGKGISNTSAKHQTGETDAMEYHTGRVAGTDGNTAVQYRYIENPWGNVWEWLDGYNEISRVPYVCWDRDNYQSDVTTGYTKIYDGWSSNIYGQGIKSTIINEDMPWCDGIPKEKGGSDTTYIPDYMDVGNSGNHVACVSGRWNVGSYCGLWYFGATYDSSFTYGYIGSRLSYKEPSAA